MPSMTDLKVSVIDKMILTLALLIVGFSTESTEGPLALTLDIIQIFAIVVVTYLIVWIFLRIMTLPLRVLESSQWLRLGVSVLSFVFVIWCYPLALQVAFFIAGLQLNVDLETLLTWTFAIRFAVSVYLRRRFTVNE